MRGDTDHLSACRPSSKARRRSTSPVASARTRTRTKHWQLPADGMPIARGTRIDLDVVMRNLLVGHRFPGGVLDIQDTWIEVEVADRDRRAARAIGARARDRDPNDEDTHVLRTLVVDENGEVLEQHEMAKFRTQIATQTLARARGAGHSLRIRRAGERRAAADRDRADAPSQPHARDARRGLPGRRRRPRARRSSPARRARATSSSIPCKAAADHADRGDLVQLGEGARRPATRPAWEREYEHGMALVGTVSERLEEAKLVLERALAIAPAGEPQAMVLVAARVGRVEARPRRRRARARSRRPGRCCAPAQSGGARQHRRPMR